MIHNIRNTERNNTLLLLGLILSIVILLASLALSITIGAKDISLNTIYEAIFAFNESPDHLIIRTIRLPRSLIALFVGAALAVAGSLMQGITRNPLASPSILGVNAGGALAVVIASNFLGEKSLQIYAIFAFLGACIAATSVYGFASLGRGGLSTLNLTLAGAALSAFTGSLTGGILIVNQRSFEEIRLWLAGSVAGRDFNLFLQVLPYLGIGLLLALALSKQITILSLGEDIAQSLGQNTAIIKLIAILSIVLLSGASIAIAGPIGFIGLIVPHIVRLLVGRDYRWILPYGITFGGILLLVADIVSRLILKPQEIPVGLIMPILGAPFFIYLILSRIKK